MPTIWSTSRNLSARFGITHSEILYARFKVGQGSTDLLARAEIGQNSQDLLAKFELQGTQDLLCKFEAQATTDLLGKFGVNQDAEDLLGKFEAQTTANLLGKANIIHSEDLIGKFEAQTTAELLVKFEAQAIRDMLGKAEIKNIDTVELLSQGEIQHSGSAELLGKFDSQIIQNLLAKFEVGQGSRELLGKTVIRHDGTPVDLPASFEAQAILDLPARAEIGQDSADLLARVEIGQNSADLLSKTVIIHPAYPVWLFGKFEISLMNAHRELVSSLEIGRSTFAELLGRFEVQATAGLLGEAEIRKSSSAEFLGKAEVRHAGTPVELLGNADIKGLSSANLKARMIIFNEKNSDAYFSLWDPSDWINEVVGIGQGFITIPWVEADAIVKTCGTSSARLTSVYAPNQYKEIRFGWGGMNWGVEAAVPPEVAPTPIDTDGRGPRRRSRASRDWRREVLTSSYNDLPARLFVTRQAFNDLAASFNIVTLSVSIIQLTTWAASVYATPAYASVLGVGFAGALEAGDTYKFDWDAMVRSWVSDNDVCFRMTVTPDGEAKQVLGSEMKDDPPSGFMGPGLDGVCPVSLSRVFTAALDGNFTFNVEMKASGSADVFWQNLVVTLVKP